MTIETLTSFLGWCTLINFALLMLSTLTILLVRDLISGIHGRMFGMDPAALPAIYLDYLGRFKLLWIVFNLVPWLSLQLMLA